MSVLQFSVVVSQLVSPEIVYVEVVLLRRDSCQPASGLSAVKYATRNNHTCGALHSVGFVAEHCNMLRYPTPQSPVNSNHVWQTSDSVRGILSSTVYDCILL